MGLILELVKECDVRWESLSEITSLKAGDRIIKSQMSDDFLYPVYGGGVKPTGQFDKYNFENSITISRAGSAGHVNWVDGKFWATDVCFVASQKDESCLIKYIFYCVKNMQFDLQKHIYGGNLPKLDKLYLWNLKIPIPPLDTQSKIVQILDNFTELTAELGLRKKQYAYYRDKLLSFDSNVKWVELGEAFTLKNGYTPSKAKKEFWENGNVPWFRMEDIRENGRILDNSIQKVHKSGVKGKLFPANSIIISTSATIGEHALIQTDYLANQRFTNLSLKDNYKDSLDIKFIFYYCFLLSKWCLHNTTVSSFAAVDMNGFRKFKIPIPPLETQQKIVNILDKFNTLANSLSEGLPKEIELRVKQYEYYRDKLLDFKNHKR